MPGNGNWPCLEGSTPPMRRKSNNDSRERQTITCALPPDRQQTVTVLASNSSVRFPPGTYSKLKSTNTNIFFTL